MDSSSDEEEEGAEAEPAAERPPGSIPATPGGAGGAWGGGPPHHHHHLPPPGSAVPSPYPGPYDPYHPPGGTPGGGHGPGLGPGGGPGRAPGSPALPRAAGVRRPLEFAEAPGAAGETTPHREYLQAQARAALRTAEQAVGMAWTPVGAAGSRQGIHAELDQLIGRVADATQASSHEALVLRSQLWKNQKAAARESRSLRLEVAQLREENRLLQRRLEMALAQGAIDRATNGAGAEARAQMDDLDWNRERDLQRMAKLIAKVRRRLTLRGGVAAIRLSRSSPKLQGGDCAFQL